MRFALGSKPVMPRHQMRRTSGGSDPSASRQSHRFAAARPDSSWRRANSARRSSRTSSRSASGTSVRKIAEARTGRRGERRLGKAGITALSFYIVETVTGAKGFTRVYGDRSRQSGRLERQRRALLTGTDLDPQPRDYENVAGRSLSSWSCMTSVGLDTTRPRRRRLVSARAASRAHRSTVGPMARNEALRGACGLQPTVARRLVLHARERRSQEKQ